MDSDDLRGIVDPADMLRYVSFERAEAGPVLDGVIEWFWSVSWDLPTGQTHRQQVLNHPAGNLTVGTIDDRGVPLDPAEGRIYGVLEGVSERVLNGSGWTVGARSTVGGLGVVFGFPAKEAAGRQLGLDRVFGSEGEAGPARLVNAVSDAETVAERVTRLRRRLESLVAGRGPTVRAEAAEVVAVARLAEQDRSITKTEHLAGAAGVSVRTLQRQFDTHVGASPSFVIRRWRIIDAVEEARRSGPNVDHWEGWSTVAVELGYADQAHLTRDFQRHLGVPPSAYRARQG